MSGYRARYQSSGGQHDPFSPTPGGTLVRATAPASSPFARSAIITPAALNATILTPVANGFGAGGGGRASEGAGGAGRRLSHHQASFGVLSPAHDVGGLSEWAPASSWATPEDGPGGGALHGPSRFDDAVLPSLAEGGGGGGRGDRRHVGSRGANRVVLAPLDRHSRA
eukprot:CAMPEP_0203812864 /NCGR_PEP_ID=MMETSP0115-20131106/4388_1 /ASSEMBLY_ACC=CAM_ASM_000227 /TAXON_ID=33651 /ORGANISM="Bicosoecid sp, Strain ms1" /LENGTH=167 /DNA_ID=CAMNT_0050721715 /DNA_START=270 /DNA_END=769 /DNA_ORIENTATION=-